ncbi:MAG: squalene/phytoene synthase family protein, partial [Thermoguttaceae bacterium]|nr:squalene/phytoene synthase family protein [Thermoguttaceae bacterium]
MDGLSALAQCHEIATASHSSFITSFRFLPAEKRQALEIIYAFMRVTDDLADESSPADPSPVFSPQTETVPEGFSLKDDLSVSDFTVRKKERLIYWKKQIELSVAPSVESFGVSSPEVSGVLSNPDDSQSQRFYNDKLLQKGLSILPAVRKVIREYSIPVVNLLNVIDGVLEDTNMPVQMPTLADSLRYCDLVAGAVGFSILPILGIYVPLDDQRLEQSALAFGRAFQWTNFLRDLQEDFSQNRFYFPQTDFR